MNKNGLTETFYTPEEAPETKDLEWAQETNGGLSAVEDVEGNVRVLYRIGFNDKQYIMDRNLAETLHKQLGKMLNAALWLEENGMTAVFLDAACKRKEEKGEGQTG